MGPPLPRGNEDTEPPGVLRRGVSPAGATVSASGKGPFYLVNYYKISLPAQKGHKTIHSVGGDTAIWFLIKNHDVKNKIEFCNNSTESRRAPPQLALQSDLCKKLSVISDFYLLYISVTLEAQLGCVWGFHECF